jgi:hypothetical protein
MSTHEMEDTPFLISYGLVPVFGRASSGHVIPGISAFVGICIAWCIAFNYLRYGALLHATANLIASELCHPQGYRLYCMYTISDI